MHPGSVRIAEGGDLPIEAVSSGFQPKAVELVVRAEGDAEWRVESLPAGVESGVFATLLPNLEQSIEYFVRSGPVMSERYRVEVEPRPVVERIDVLYTYPAYTGRPPTGRFTSFDRPGFRSRRNTGSARTAVTPTLSTDPAPAVV